MICVFNILGFRNLSHIRAALRYNINCCHTPINKTRTMVISSSSYLYLTLSTWLLALCPCIPALQGSSQALSCYSSGGGGGDVLRATDYIPDLGRYSFNNKIQSCCVGGVWVMYAGAGYNKDNPTASSWWVYGDYYCTNVPQGFENKASSLRFVGAPDDWKYDTLNLYFREFFIGDEEFMYSDKSRLVNDNKARSIIVTGCSGWTLYQYDDYQGAAVCVFPSDTLSCNPGFYSTTTSLGMMDRQVSSVRRGCWARERVYPENNGVAAPVNHSDWIFPSKK